MLFCTEIQREREREREKGFKVQWVLVFSASSSNCCDFTFIFYLILLPLRCMNFGSLLHEESLGVRKILQHDFSVITPLKK